MNILIVSATKEEVLPLLGNYSFQQTENIYSYKNIDVLITGVGMVAMAFSMGKFVNKHYDIILNAGIAGSFNKKIQIGDIVNVTEDMFSELGAEDGERFLSIEEMGLKGSSKLEVGNSKLEAGSWKSLTKVKSITINTVHGNDSSIKKIIERLNPDIETMEGAAFMYACKQMNVPCIQIRAISNYVEKRDKSKWNIPLAIANLNNMLIQFIESL